MDSQGIYKAAFILCCRPMKNYLTADIVNPDSYYREDPASYSRGRFYYYDKRVTLVDFDGETAHLYVRGNSYPKYEVFMRGSAENKLAANCNCPYAQEHDICKHIFASMYALREYIQTETQKTWQYRLKMGLNVVPKQKKPKSSRLKVVVGFALIKSEGGGSVHFQLAPFLIKSTEWPNFIDFTQIEDIEERNLFLDKNRSWRQHIHWIDKAQTTSQVINLGADGVQVVNLLLKSGNYYYSLDTYSSFLPLIASLNAPVFLAGSRGGIKERLLIKDEPVKLEAAMVSKGDHFVLDAGLTYKGNTYTSAKDNLFIISNGNPGWALAGNTILPVENPEAMNMFNYLPVEIPTSDEVEFRESFLPELLERIGVQSDMFSWTVVDEKPIARIYLSEDKGKLYAQLRYAYGDFELDFDPKGPEDKLIDLPGNWAMAKILRDIPLEDDYFHALTDARYGLKRSTDRFEPGWFELRAKTHPFDFLMYNIGLLTKAGFEIFGEEKIKSAKINRATPTLSLNVTSGLDWFDVEAVAHFGEQQVAYKDLSKALRKREKYIKLADGSVGRIPDDWLQRYKKLFDLAEDGGNSLRVRNFHLPLVDMLLKEADETQVSDEFVLKRDVLKSFEKIEPQPVAGGFTGELRPYQKAGVDWLYFLHQFGFGGCLADDMGLGKTIQVLAFLALLKEQGKLENGVLLVVPKSLIANWQREAQTFTPQLTFMEFMGNARKKETGVFSQCDVTLTTYGTMLRDVAFLLENRFSYVILDESQAIKNPLSQSAKACRLLNSEHRLVMTGTPVENNTFDLWSQFAFINPGLLGSLDYFKNEFSSGVEDGRSNDALLLLRQLVYPFILRRTKEQVAPELPPLTERIVFTDMQGAQRALYQRTRDYYRKLLLGMIEDEGLNQSRMKVLEGLLRLRQICIHPALVEAGFHGESAKFEILLETIENLRSEGHKALIFSQFVQTLFILRSELDQRKIPYAYLDGQTHNRQQQVDLFQQDPAIPFFLISLKAGGVGLNLTAADYVIHIDPWWNPAVEMQASDRAHRIGQDKPVFVYKYIIRDSIEEKILKLQEKKKDLVDQLISEESSFFKSITTDDVKVLFS
ncbi:MAG: serine/threonine protein kinase [Chloroflexi bacterium HGW-Chloroflexi-10]|nr:MAG: serine/threonine protein kinase [Chloroflexi bacterium HGW-Chloroflexi-10]